MVLPSMLQPSFRLKKPPNKEKHGNKVICIAGNGLFSSLGPQPGARDMGFQLFHHCCSF